MKCKKHIGVSSRRIISCRVVAPALRPASQTSKGMLSWPHYSESAGRSCTASRRIQTQMSAQHLVARFKHQNKSIFTNVDERGTMVVGWRTWAITHRSLPVLCRRAQRQTIRQPCNLREQHHRFCSSAQLLSHALCEATTERGLLAHARSPVELLCRLPCASTRTGTSSYGVR